jgi:hypothetical protein
MKVDAGLIIAKEDLSNVEIRFIDSQPAWTVLPEGQVKNFRHINELKPFQSLSLPIDFTPEKKKGGN